MRNFLIDLFGNKNNQENLESYKFAVYLLADKNISWTEMPSQSNLSEIKLAHQPLFTINDISSYYWEKHSFVLSDEAEKNIANNLRLIDETIIPFVVVVNEERIYGGIFLKDLMLAAAYAEIPFIRFSGFNKDRDGSYFSGFEYVKNTHHISFYLTKDKTNTDPRNDSKIKQVLKEENKLVFSDI